MTYDIPPHRRGDTWDGINSITINVNSTPIDLTNAKVKIDFRQSIDSPAALTLSTDNNGIVIIQPSTTGKIKLLPKLIEIPFGKYLYDLQVIYPSGIVKTYISGTWTILPDITL